MTLPPDWSSALNTAEFDKFADEYHAMHARNIAVSGESPEYFAHYKIRDVAFELRRAGIAARRILDFGAGVGNSVPHIVRLLPGVHLTCADVSRQSLDIARSRYACSSVRYIELGGAKLPFENGTFDAVFSACVFHHIPAEEHGLWLKELRRVTRSEGMVLVYEHNPLNPVTCSAVRQCPFDENAVLIRSRQLHRSLEAAGWSEVRIHFRLFFPHFLAFARPAERLLARLPLGAQYYATARHAQ